MDKHWICVDHFTRHRSGIYVELLCRSLLAEITAGVWRHFDLPHFKRDIYDCFLCIYRPPNKIFQKVNELCKSSQINLTTSNFVKVKSIWVEVSKFHSQFNSQLINHCRPMAMWCKDGLASSSGIENWLFLHNYWHVSDTDLHFDVPLIQVIYFTL